MGLLSKITGRDEAPAVPPPTYLPLPPLPRPVFLFPQSPYLAQNPVTLTLTRGLKSGKRYPICLTTDPGQQQPFFFVDYADMSMHETKSLYDAKGKFLFDIKERQSSWNTQCYVKTSNEDRVGNIGKEKGGEVLGQFGTVEQGGRGGNELYREGDVLSVKKGEWGKGDVDVKLRNSNEIIARAHFTKKVKEYQVGIAPGVDMTIVIAFCVSMDFQLEQKGGSDYLEAGANGLEALANLSGAGGGGGGGG